MVLCEAIFSRPLSRGTPTALPPPFASSHGFLPPAPVFAPPRPTHASRSEEVKICELFCEMDTEDVQTFDTLMPNKDGVIEKSNRSGKDSWVKGRFFVIKRPVPFDLASNAALKQMIKDMTLAINKYYAFGSCFSDDAT